MSAEALIALRVDATSMRLAIVTVRSAPVLA